MLALVLVASLSTSCSIALQDSVRSSGVYCSTSRFYIISDLLLAAGFAALVSANDGPAESYIPAGLLVGSSLIGIYKRGNCVRHRATATPEEWARDAEREDRKDAEQMARMRNLAHQMDQPTYAPQPTYTPSQPTYTPSQPTYTPSQPTYTPPASSGSTSSTPDWAVQRSNCHAECDRRHDAASTMCRSQWTGSDDASIHGLAECIRMMATQPHIDCSHACDR